MGPTSDAVKIKSGLDRSGPRGKNLICFLFLTTEFMENMENTRIVSKNKIRAPWYPVSGDFFNDNMNNSIIIQP